MGGLLSLRAGFDDQFPTAAPVSSRQIRRCAVARPVEKTISGRMFRSVRVFIVMVLLLAAAPAQARDVFERVRDRYADNGGVRIHYVTLGHGPLVVMIHGFPDFWYTWRDQMAGLSRHYQVVAIDQ